MTASHTGDDPGLLVVLTGPSGVGKDTVVAALEGRLDDLVQSTSVTTRAPRPGEKHGRDYHFVTEAAFHEMVDDGELLEWTEYAGHLYGTPAEPVAEAVADGRVVILTIEVDGALQVRERAPEPLLVFLEPPDLQELERRLRERGTEDAAALERRLEVARRELDQRHLFDAVIVNDDLDTCVRQVAAEITEARVAVRHSPRS